MASTIQFSSIFLKNVFFFYISVFRYSGPLEAGYKRMFRTRLHFLSSLILVSIVTLSWDWVVGREHVYNLNREESLINRNSVNMHSFSLLSDYLTSSLGKGEGQQCSSKTSSLYTQQSRMTIFGVSPEHLRYILVVKDDDRRRFSRTPLLSKVDDPWLAKMIIYKRLFQNEVFHFHRNIFGLRVTITLSLYVLSKESFFNTVWGDLIKLIPKGFMLDLISHDRMIPYNLYFYRIFQPLYDLILN